MDCWISIAAKVFRRDKSMGKKLLPGRFEDWLYKEGKIEEQTIYNYRSLCKWMSIVPVDELSGKHDIFC